MKKLSASNIDQITGITEFQLHQYYQLMLIMYITSNFTGTNLCYFIFSLFQEMHAQCSQE